MKLRSSVPVASGNPTGRAGVQPPCQACGQDWAARTAQRIASHTMELCDDVVLCTSMYRQLKTPEQYAETLRRETAEHVPFG